MRSWAAICARLSDTSTRSVRHAAQANPMYSLRQAHTQAYHTTRSSAMCRVHKRDSHRNSQRIPYVRHYDGPLLMTSILDELFADYGLQAQPVRPQLDPCARLTVKPLAGGMPDAPVVKHNMRLGRDPKCPHRGKCACERVYMPDHRDTYGICMCPPVDVEAHYKEVEGIRIKGVSSQKRRMKPDRALAGKMQSSADLRGKPRNLRPLADRMAATFTLATRAYAAGTLLIVVWLALH